MEIDIKFKLSPGTDGWWVGSYSATVQKHGGPKKLAEGNCSGGSSRVVVDSMMRHVREEIKDHANKIFNQ